MNHSNLCLTPIGVVQVKYLQAEPQPWLSSTQLSPLVSLYLLTMKIVFEPSLAQESLNRAQKENQGPKNGTNEMNDIL